MEKLEFPLSAIPECWKQLTLSTGSSQASPAWMPNIPNGLAAELPVACYRRNGTMSETAEPKNGQSRKRAAVKTPSRQAAMKAKSTIHLSIEASQRLTVHAAMLGMDRSELVESLITKHLRRFVVSDRGGGESSNEGMEESRND